MIQLAEGVSAIATLDIFGDPLSEIDGDTLETNAVLVTEAERRLSELLADPV